jgi:hypothetical protein
LNDDDDTEVNNLILSEDGDERWTGIRFHLAASTLAFEVAFSAVAPTLFALTLDVSCHFD